MHLQPTVKFDRPSYTRTYGMMQTLNYSKLCTWRVVSPKGFVCRTFSEHSWTHGNLNMTSYRRHRYTRALAVFANKFYKYIKTYTQSV